MYVLFSKSYVLLMIIDNKYDKKAEIIAMNENPMKIPKVPPTELISPRESNNRYSS